MNGRQTGGLREKPGSFYSEIGGLRPIPGSSSGCWLSAYCC